MTDIIVHHIGIDNSWAFVETKGARFEVGLTQDEGGLSSVTFSPVDLTEEDMNLIENEVNTEPVKVKEPTASIEQLGICEMCGEKYPCKKCGGE